MSYIAIVVATVAGFAAAGGYYAVLGSHLQKLSNAPADMPPWALAVELIKHLIVATVVAGLEAGIGIAEWPGAMLLGFSLWVGFPVTLLLGSVIHENVPWRLAALHAGTGW